MPMKRGYFSDLNGLNMFSFPILEDREDLIDTIRGTIFELSNAIEYSDLHQVEISFSDSIAMRDLLATALHHIENEEHTDAA